MGRKPIPIAPNPAADIFDRALSRSLGSTGAVGAPTRPMGPVPGARPSVPMPSTAVAPRISTGGINLDSDVEDAYEKQFGEAAVGGGGDPFDFLTKALNNLDREKTLREQVIKEQQKKVIAEQDRVVSAIGQVPGGWENAVTGFAKSPAGRALDLIQRPDYAFMEGMRSAAAGNLQRAEESGIKDAGDAYKRGEISKDEYYEAMADHLEGEHKNKEWYEPTQEVKDLGTGFWRGLSGQRKTGFGDVVEAGHPELSLTTKRILGIGGDLFLSPTNYTGLGASKVLRATKAPATLEKVAGATEAAVRNRINSALSTSAVRVPTGTRNIPGQAGGFRPAKEAIEQETVDAVADVFRNTGMEFGGGGLVRRIIGSGKKNTAATAAARGAEVWRSGKLSTFNKYVDQWRKHIDGTAPLSKTRLDIMKRQEPLFKEFLNNVPNTGRVTPRVIDDAANKVRGKLDNEVEHLTKGYYDDLKDIYYNAPGIRVGSKVIPFKRVGRAFSTGYRGVSKKLGLDDVTKALAYEAKFPGRLSLLSQRVKAIGVQRYLDFERSIKERIQTNKITRAERKDITAAIDGSYPMTDPRLEDARQWIMAEYDRIFQEEINAGVRRSKPDPNNPGQRISNTPQVRNYTFVWTRKGGKKQRIFKNSRKQSIRKTGTVGGYQTADAAAQGLKPLDDAFEALLMRQLKANRDLSRGWFKNDLLNNYGVMAKELQAGTRGRRGLVEMNTNDLSDLFRQNMADQDKWYLPKEISEVLDEFTSLSKFDSEALPLRLLRKVLTKYKAFRTVYLPGYHVRNMISDMFMGFLDGVSARTYGEVLRKVRLLRLPGEKIPHFHPSPRSQFKIGPNWTLNGDEAWDLYRRNASSGYVVSELGSVKTAVPRAVRRISEGREDFGRVVHFIHALRDEYNKVHAKDLVAAQAKAVEQAVYRVNHYKFDYGALTKWEQKGMKLVVPFYTFTRKAFPTLAESLMLNPKNLIRANKVRENMSGEGFSDFNPATVAPWMREVGYAITKDEKEPIALTGDVLPTSVFQSVLPYPTGWQNISTQYGAQLNPILQAIQEMQSGKDVFLGSDVEPGANYFGNEIGPWSELQDFRKNREKGLPMWEAMMNNRLLGPGFPARRITSEQQQFRMKEWEDQLIEGKPGSPFDKFNMGLGREKNLRIYTSRAKEGSSYKVKDMKSGKTLFQSTNPFEALEWAEKGTSQAKIPITLERFNNEIGEPNGIHIYYSQRQDGNSYRVARNKDSKVIFESKKIEKAFEWANDRVDGNAYSLPEEEERPQMNVLPMGFGGGTSSRPIMNDIMGMQAPGVTGGPAEPIEQEGSGGSLLEDILKRVSEGHVPEIDNNRTRKEMREFARQNRRRDRREARIPPDPMFRPMPTNYLEDLPPSNLPWRNQGGRLEPSSEMGNENMVWNNFNSDISATPPQSGYQWNTQDWWDYIFNNRRGAVKPKDIRKFLPQG